MREVRLLERVDDPDTTDFLRAIAANDIDQVLTFVVRRPLLLELHPQCLLLTDGERKTVFHWLCDANRLRLVHAALGTSPGRRALDARDDNGDTGLHRAALLRTSDCLDAILKAGAADQSLWRQNNDGLLPLHLAVLRGHISSSVAMMELAEKTLLVKDHSGMTPLHCLAFSQAAPSGQLAFLRRAIEKSSVQEKLCHIDYFLRLHSDDVTCEQRIRRLRRERLPAVTPVVLNSILNSNLPVNHAGQESVGRSLMSAVRQGRCSTLIESLDLSSAVPEGDQRLRYHTMRLLQQLGVVGVYGDFGCLKEETFGQFHSLGDENATVQLVNLLVDLGAPGVQLRLSLPGPGAGAADETDDSRAVELNKLALLMPGFAAAKPLPQRLLIGQSVVTIVEYGDQSVQPSVVFSFLDLAEARHKVSCEHYMVLKPYRFEWSAPDSRVLYTNFDGWQVQKIPLSLPANSLLPELSASMALDSDEAERRWLGQMLDASPINSLEQAKSLGKVFEWRRQGRIHLSVVYGLHHRELAGRRTFLLHCWLGALRASADRKNQRKATLVLIGRATSTPEVMTCLQRLQGIAVIALEDDDAISKLNQMTSAGVLAIGLLPELPKPVFQYLLRISDLPVLTEGANTTSFLLQTGHPYLSVLPDGETPIPCDMGYPLEALKIEAHSYKLRSNEAERQFLEQLHALVVREQYQDALLCLNQNKRQLSGLRFLNDDGRTRVPAVTVTKLLAKGAQGRLGLIEKSALIAAVDPSVAVLADYVYDCLDSESVVSDHFALQSGHVRHSFNNALIATLTRFAQIKHLQQACVEKSTSFPSKALHP